MPSIRSLFPILTVVVLAGHIIPAARAADNVWQSTDTGDWHTAGNWLNGIPDTTAERAVFNGTGTVNDLTFAAAVGGGSGFGGILVDSGQTSPLTINNTGAAGLIFRIGGTAATNPAIIINPGAGAFSLGTSGSTMLLVPQTANTFTFQNDSNNTATLGNRISNTTGGGNAAYRLHFTGSGNWQVDSVLAPSGGGGTPFLTKDGSGTLTLTGNNTYTGTTIVNAGVLQVGAGGTTGRISATGGLTIASGANVNFNRSDTVTVANAISGAGSLAHNGTGTLILTGANTYTGTTTVSAGTILQIGDGGATGQIGSGAISLGNGSTLAFNRSDNSTAAGAISGAGMIVKNGTGTLTLSGNHTYTGATTVNTGTLQIGNGLTTGQISVASPITVAASSTIAFNRSDDITVSNSISGAGNFAKNGSGTLTLAGTSSYTGSTIINGGTLRFTGAGLSSSSSLSVGVGSAVSLANNVASTTTFAGLDLAASSTVKLDWTGPSTDTLATTAVATTSGLVTIDLDRSATPSGDGHTLLQAAGGFGAATFLLANTTDFTATLSATDTAVTIGSYAAETPLTTAYWHGADVVDAISAMALSTGSVSNWSSTPAYTATALTPGADTDIIFTTATGATQQSNAFLGADMTAKSLTFADAIPVTIMADGYRITLLSNGTGPNSAINATEDTTINSGIVLGSSQTWTVVGGKTLTVGGGVSGANSLTKSGEGTLALSSANSHTGTIIEGGMLVVSHLSALGTGNVAIKNGATLRVGFISATPTLANTFSVASGNTALLDVIGSGTANNPLTIGTNGITIDGTLRVTRSAGNTGTTNFTGALSGAGTLEIGNTQSGIAPVAVSGSQGRSGFTTTNAYAAFTGNVHILDGGNLLTGGASSTLTGQNVTIDSGGYLSIQGGTTTLIGAFNGSGSVTKNASATVATLSVAGGEFSGVIAQNLLLATGTVALTKNSPGILTLSGTNTYTGPTNVNGGILQIGNGGTTGEISGSSAISLAAGTNLIFNRSDAIHVSNAISGAGNVIKIGTGTLTLSGVSNYTGLTGIEEGAILVSGSLSGSAVIINSGTLGSVNGAIGTVTGAITVGNGAGSANAILSPGAAGIGTLATGSVTFHSDGLFELEINTDSLTSDLLSTTGTVNLGDGIAELNIFDFGTAALTGGERFTFIHAEGGISGTFNGIGEGDAIFIGATEYHISYAANGGQDVVLTAVPEPGAAVSLISGLGLLLGLRRQRKQFPQ